MSTHALSFGAAARLYDTIRPTYPDQAVAWTLGERPLRVLDLGAGTGLLTRVLTGAGHEVVSVDPDAQMLSVLAERNPSATVLQGSAERIPLPAGAVDAVVCGQAYHWFDRQTALPEIARVLTPRGVFAPMWNLRDESVPWVGRFSEIIGSEGADLERQGGTRDFGPWFTGTEHAVFDHGVAMTAAGLLDLVRSRSYYLTAEPERQAQLEADVRELLATHPDLAGRDRLEMPYKTHVYRSQKTGE
jgi:SAM-dependent methyltransferase